jgi:hypothetical protein
MAQRSRAIRMALRITADHRVHIAVRLPEIQACGEVEFFPCSQKQSHSFAWYSPFCDFAAKKR